MGLIGEVTMPKRDDARFHAAYRRLALEGRCDGVGGMECRRVFREWRNAGMPPDIDAFIIDRANVGPNGPYPDGPWQWVAPNPGVAP